MSWKTREKKRQARGRDAATARSRRQHGRETAGRWFLTPAREKVACAKCSALIPVGGDLIYRHEPREFRCLRCGTGNADSRGYRVSVRWERAQHAKARKPDQVDSSRRR